MIIFENCRKVAKTRPTYLLNNRRAGSKDLEGSYIYPLCVALRFLFTTLRVGKLVERLPNFSTTQTK